MWLESPLSNSQKCDTEGEERQSLDLGEEEGELFMQS